jgi:crotonobetainyl-CoA:carnitine CoA-transferase CaiB-like acyl-CoA transferase
VLAESQTPLPEAHPRLTIGTTSTSMPTATSNLIHLPHGTHNQEVLAELGFSEDDIKQLEAKGAFGTKLGSKL